MVAGPESGPPGETLLDSQEFQGTLQRDPIDRLGLSSGASRPEEQMSAPLQPYLPLTPPDEVGSAAAAVASSHTDSVTDSTDLVLAIREPADVASEPPPLRPPASACAQVAQIINQVAPRYPDLARQARIQGVVLLEANISTEGTVENLRVIAGHPLLSQAAVEAVYQWQYQPTLLNGQPVPVVTTISVRFTLN